MEFTHQGKIGRFILTEGSGHIRISPLITITGCQVAGAVQQLSGQPVHGDVQAKYGGAVQDFVPKEFVERQIAFKLEPPAVPAELVPNKSAGAVIATTETERGDALKKAPPATPLGASGRGRHADR